MPLSSVTFGRELEFEGVGNDDRELRLPRPSVLVKTVDDFSLFGRRKTRWRPLVKSRFENLL